MSIFVYYKKRPLSDDDLTKWGGFPTYIRLPIHAQFSILLNIPPPTIPDHDAGLPYSNRLQGREYGYRDFPQKGAIRIEKKGKGILLMAWGYPPGDQRGIFV